MVPSIKGPKLRVRIGSHTLFDNFANVFFIEDLIHEIGMGAKLIHSNSICYFFSFEYKDFHCNEKYNFNQYQNPKFGLVKEDGVEDQPRHMRPKKRVRETTRVLNNIIQGKMTHNNQTKIEK